MKIRLNSYQKAMLSDLSGGPVQCARWDFSNSRTPAQMIAKGLIEICDHPTFKQRDGLPVRAYALTTKGAEYNREKTTAALTE